MEQEAAKKDVREEICLLGLVHFCGCEHCGGSPEEIVSGIHAAHSQLTLKRIFLTNVEKSSRLGAEEKSGGPWRVL